MTKTPEPSARPLWRRASLAALGPLLAVVGGGVGSFVAHALELHGADDRLAAVGLGIALPLLASYGVRPRARLRWLVGLLGLPWLAVFAAPRSAIVISWLAGGILFLGFEAVVHAARATWELPVPRPARAGLLVVGVGPGLYFWSAAAVVLVNTVLIAAPVRLAHLSPHVGADEATVSLLTADGYRIEGTFTAGAAGAGGVVLVHGVADGRDRWLPWIERLRELRMHALRIDARAHGRSDGAVVTYGQREGADLLAALAWLRAREGVDRSRLFAVGTSMGGGTVLAASDRMPVAGAVVLAPASSYPPLVERRTGLLGPLAPFVLNGSAHLAVAAGQRPMTRWRPRRHMSRTLPVLVLHGTHDETIPIRLSRELSERANVRLIELDCGHDDIPAATSREPAWRDIRAFLRAPEGSAAPVSGSDRLGLPSL